jgi:hypothetical protein
MNWIDFPNIGRLEVIQDFKYVGPLKAYQTNMWSSFSHYSLKLKCPNEIYLFGLRNQNFKEIFYKFSETKSLNFKVLSIQVTSQFKDHKIIKIILENVEYNEISKSTLRSLKLSELF